MSPKHRSFRGLCTPNIRLLVLLLVLDFSPLIPPLMHFPVRIANKSFWFGEKIVTLQARKVVALVRQPVGRIRSCNLRPLMLLRPPLTLSSFNRCTTISRAFRLISKQHARTTCNQFRTRQISCYSSFSADSHSSLQPESSPKQLSSMSNYEEILKGKYPAKAHAKRVVEYMRKKNPAVNGVLYLEGQKTRMIEDNDGEAPFR